jgi:hypothetical protein
LSVLYSGLFHTSSALLATVDHLGKSFCEVLRKAYDNISRCVSFLRTAKDCFCRQIGSRTFQFSIDAAIFYTHPVEAGAFALATIVTNGTPESVTAAIVAAEAAEAAGSNCAEGICSATGTP